MREKKKNAVSIYFNKEEYEKLKQATRHSVMAESTFLRVLVKEKIIDIYAGETSIHLKFSLDNQCDRSVHKTRIVLFSDSDYEKLIRICGSVYLTPSNLIKYMIMPELEKNIQAKDGKGDVVKI